jgi:hypothetical protein
MIAAPRKLPPLESGDRLTAAEFERRYHAMPNVKKAELIDGEVHMPSPVSWNNHGSPHLDACVWLGTYKVHTPGVDAGDNATVRLDNKNQPQPDLTLIVLPEYGGRTEFDDKGYLEGAPELVFEVSASTESIDMNKKWQMYRRVGVLEYVVWRVYDEAIDWFSFGSGASDRIVADPADGLLKSRVFSGLWLDATALVQRDLAKAIASLMLGIQSEAHAEFARALVSRKK